MLKALRVKTARGQLSYELTTPVIFDMNYEVFHMRYARLEAYLNTVLPQSQVNVLISAFDVLIEAGIDGQDHAIEQELALAEDGNSSILVQSIYNIAIPLYQLVLGEFGITLNEHAQLIDMVDILQGLLTLDNYGDPVTITQFCDNSEGPEEGLSEILPLVGAYTVGHYLTLFKNVDARLLERIEETSAKQIVDAPEDTETMEGIRTRLRNYISIVGSNDLFILEDIRAGQRPGLPLESYLDGRTDALEEVSKRSPEDLARQILGYVLATTTPIDQVRSVCGNEMDSLCEDKSIVTKADITLVGLISEVTSREQA